MGYNPFRKRVQRRSDIVVVAAALIAIALMLAWAAIPR
jgi:hypothetical protein